MDYYKRIQNAIDFIESNLTEEITITEIASKAFFSAFHFQRIFQTISGFSVQEYIRKRRLSEAAVLLKETNRNILEIAISCQYNSHEAFTRAFEDCFGMTPAKYRKELTNISLQPKINFLAYQKEIKGEMSINKPSIVYLNKISIVGYGYQSNLNNYKHFEEIPRFYDDFYKNEYSLKIPDRIMPGVSYGISCNFHDDGVFSFVIGEEVKNFSQGNMNNLINFEIPEGKYAEFKVYGSIELIQNTRRYIHGTWLPNSNYERKEDPDFETVNDFSSSLPDEINLKTYIPIK